MNGLNRGSDGLGDGLPRPCPPRPNFVLSKSSPPSQRRQWEAAQSARARLAVAAARRFPAAPASASTSAVLSPATSASASAIPSQSSAKPRCKKRFKKYNSFNLFFMLERQLLLHSRGGGINAIENPINTSESPLVEHKDLKLPSLCKRYSHLPLTKNWLLELTQHHNKKRKHEKSHGLIPFKELAQMVAKNYREIDDETQSFVNEVARRLGWHVDEMETAENQRREEETRRDLEERERAAVGAPPPKKRKATPVVSAAETPEAAAGDKPGSLSRDEATTVQQLSLLGATGDGAAPRTRHPLPMCPFVAGSQMNRSPARSHPSRSQVPPGTTSRPFDPHSRPTDLSDAALGRLQVELAGAMDARREVDKKIMFLKEKITMHLAARKEQNLRQMTLYGNLSSLLAGASVQQLGPAVRHPAPNSMPHTGNTPSLQQIENMLKEDIAMKERLAQMQNIPPSVLEALCRSAGGASAPSPRERPVAAETLKFKEEEAPSEKRRRLTVEKLEALLAAKKRTNSKDKAEAKEPTMVAQSGRPASAAESESPPSSGDSEMAMPTPSRRSHAGVEGDDSSRQRFVSPQALSPEEFQFYKHLYATALNQQYPRVPSNINAQSNGSSFAAAAAARTLAAESMKDLAFYESLSHNLRRSDAKSNAEASRQALLESLRGGAHPRSMMAAQHAPFFNQSHPSAEGK